jgi:hypothetical protein
LPLFALVLALAGLAFLTLYPAYFGRAAGLPYIAIGSALVGLGGIVFMTTVLLRLVEWQKARRLAKQKWGRDEERG